MGSYTVKIFLKKAIKRIAAFSGKIYFIIFNEAQKADVFQQFQQPLSL